MLLQVEAVMAAVNGGVIQHDDDVDAASASRQNVVTNGLPAPRPVDVCVASPERLDDELDRLSCEPDGSSSRLDADAIDDFSACSTPPSSRSRSPATKLRRSPPDRVSTTTSTSLYGQQQTAAAAAGFLSDVHGSLPLLSLPRAFDDERRVQAAAAAPGWRDVPKSASLHGYQQWLTVDDCRRQRRRMMMAAGYRPLAEQRARHTLSRLDVEYINRSQIFEMISGQSGTATLLKPRSYHSAYQHSFYLN